MNTDSSAFDHAHHLGEPATRPIAGLPGRLPALLLMKLRSEGLSRQKTAAKSLLILAGEWPRASSRLASPHSDAFNRGFKVERCNLSARAVALIYNWWSWYVRLAHPKTRLEAITSRPLLLSGVARLTEHASQSRLLLTLTHAGLGHPSGSVVWWTRNDAARLWNR